MATTFHPFPRLPLELRDQIWQDALSGASGPALYFYERRGYWRSRLLTESDHSYRPGEDDMALTFHPDSMDTHHQFEVPLAFVNREARRAVLRWVHKQGIEIRPQPAGDVMFARHFNPELDALYVPGDKWLEFCLEPSDRMFRPDLVEKHVEVHSSLGKLAVPLEEFLDHDVISWVPEMLEKWFVSLGVVLVVMDPQPDSIRGPWSWEVRGGEGWWLSWNKESAKFDLHEGSGGGGDGDLRKKILVAANGRLRYEMLICGRSQLEVRPVFGVRARR